MSQQPKHRKLGERSHEPFEGRFNTHKELRRISETPFWRLVREVRRGKRSFDIEHDEILSSIKTYELYYLSIEKFLLGSILHHRWLNNVYWKKKNRIKLSEKDIAIEEKFKPIAKYRELDFYACVIYSRMLMDKVIVLSRYFLPKDISPSFTSFNEHKKFFARNLTTMKAHNEYAEHIVGNTEWFEAPLKLVRDKYMFHAGPKHLRIFGFSGNTSDYCLIILDQGV
jgi:hypothetical protein